MLKRILLAAAISLPTYAQTTTTVTTDPPPQTAAAPPPQSPQSPSTQVVVNPPPPNQAAPAPDPVPASPPATPPPPPAQVVVAPVESPPTFVRDEGISVENRPAGRSAVAIVAVDGLYGGIAGGIVGGGVTLIDQGNNWARDIMVGAGIGVLVGASYGVFEAATQNRGPDRAIADRNPAASDIQGVAPASYATRF
jgi:hypothetical protein